MSSDMATIPHERGDRFRVVYENGRGRPVIAEVTAIRVDILTTESLYWLRIWAARPGALPSDPTYFMSFDVDGHGNAERGLAAKLPKEPHV